jgi:hypothetical protein
LGIGKIQCRDSNPAVSQAQLSPAFRAGFLLRDSAHHYYGELGEAAIWLAVPVTVVRTLLSSSPNDSNRLVMITLEHRSVTHELTTV